LRRGWPVAGSRARTTPRRDGRTAATRPRGRACGRCRNTGPSRRPARSRGSSWAVPVCQWTQSVVPPLEMTRPRGRERGLQGAGTRRGAEHGHVPDGGRGRPRELPAECRERLPVLHRCPHRPRRPRARCGVRDHEGLGRVAERRRRERLDHAGPPLAAGMRTGQGWHARGPSQVTIVPQGLAARLPRGIRCFRRQLRARALAAARGPFRGQAK
jgi:hypothetical protein